jgi:6-phosphofructokinase 2
MSKLGGKSTAVVPAGGHTGKTLVELLDREGFKAEDLTIAGPTRENLTVLDQSAGVQYRFVMPGPDVTDEELEKIERKISGLSPETDYLVVSGSLPAGVDQDFYARIIGAAGEAGVKTILDTSGEPLKRALAEGVFLIKPNIGELVRLADRDLGEEPRQVEFARDLIDRGNVEVVVISLGAGGAFLVTKDSSIHFRSPTVPVVSKVGAGDSMVAGITYGLAQDWSLEESVRLGVAAGASAVMTPGTELCRKEDTFRLWEQIDA